MGERPSGLKRARCRIFVATWWRRWSPLLVALRDNARTAASCCKVGGAMLARIRSWLTGMACRQPETVLRALLSIVSSFLVWELLHQTGAQYSVAEKTRAWVETPSVLVEASQVVPVRWRIKAMQVDVFADRFSSRTELDS